MTTPTLIGHVDADCFYVSCERVRHGQLRRIPVGVLGNQGACVIAKSYELKARGVKTGMPIWEAVPLCPEAVFVKRDFRWYEALSRRLLAIIGEVSPSVEYYSIDEMFFDASLLPQTTGLPMHEAARELQQMVLNKTGIPASVGISKTKTLAKLASDAEKPFGTKVLLEKTEIAEYLKRLPVEEITGIARRSSQKLAAHGIVTCADFADADRLLIRRLLTVKGEGLWYELHGEPVNAIQTKRPAHKHIARGGSIGKASADYERILGWLVRNAERLVEALYAHGYTCGKLSLDLQFKDGRGFSQRASLPESTAQFEFIMPTVSRLFHSCWRPGLMVSYMHLIAGELQPGGFRQLGLLSSANLQVDRLKRAVNAKIGRFALRSGETLALKDIYEDEANDYDICDIQGKMCF